MPRTSSPRGGQPGFVLGDQSVGLFVLPLGFGDVVGDLVLPLFQAGQDRPPGELPQHGQQDQEHEDRPDRQVGIDRQGIGVGVAVAGVGFRGVRKPLLGTLDLRLQTVDGQRHARRTAARCQHGQPAESSDQFHDETRS